MKKIIILLFFLIIYKITNTFSFIKIDPKTQHFIDKNGRVSIFHGVNVVYKLPPFYPPIQDHFNSEVSFCEKDMQDLQNWGFNMIRLFVSWNGLETSPGVYNETYLGEIKKIVKKCEKYGIYVLLDCHQDLLSNFMCGEGMPDFAVDKTLVKNFPHPLTFKLKKDSQGKPLIKDCTKHAFGEYYLSHAVSKTFQNIYENANGIQTRFIKFWGKISKTFKNETNVLGYDLLNEPWFGDIYKHPSLLFHPGKTEKELLFPFYQKIHNEIRNSTGDNNHIIFYEPAIISIGSTIGFKNGPGGKEYDDRQAVSFHIYCGQEGKEFPLSKYACELFDDFFFHWRDKDLKRIGGGRFLTEFGASTNTPVHNDELKWFMKNINQRFWSNSYWQFKNYKDFTTQTLDGESFYDQYGNLQTNKVRVLSQPYAQKICGEPIKMENDIDKNHFTLIYKPGNCNNKPTEISINYDLHYKPNKVIVEISPPESATYHFINKNKLLVNHSPQSIGKVITISIKKSN